MRVSQVRKCGFKLSVRYFKNVFSAFDRAVSGALAQQIFVIPSSEGIDATAVEGVWKLLPDTLD